MKEGSRSYRRIPDVKFTIHHKYSRDIHSDNRPLTVRQHIKQALYTLYSTTKELTELTNPLAEKMDPQPPDMNVALVHVKNKRRSLQVYRNSIAAMRHSIKDIKDSRSPGNQKGS